MKHKRKQKGKTKPSKAKEKVQTGESGCGTMEGAEEMMLQLYVMKENECALDKQFSCRA
jgi:hypothetical protein